MKHAFVLGAVFASIVLWASGVGAAGPYIQIETGVLSRDVIEKSPSLVGFKDRGTADSTRLIAKAGYELGDLGNIYLQGGWADLAIDEFDNYDASLAGAWGGGLRLNLYRSPFRDQLTLFIEGSYLRSTTDDQVEIQQCFSGCGTSSAVFLSRLADETIQWNEYTVLLGASGRYEGFGPYGGIRLSKVDGKDRVRAAPDGTFTTSYRANLDLKEDDNFGVFFGADFFLDRSEKTALNLEVSLIDQDSFRVAIRRAF